MDFYSWYVPNGFDTLKIESVDGLSIGSSLDAAS